MEVEAPQEKTPEEEFTDVVVNLVVGTVAMVVIATGVAVGVAIWDRLKKQAGQQNHALH